jgi:DNA-binding CsgD family transcriptional regulator
MMMQLECLSKREREVVVLLMEGRTNKQIAFALGISERTVEFHLKNVYIKYDVRSRVELILILVKSTGDEPGKSTVGNRGKTTENRDRHPFILNWRRSFRDAIFINGEEIDMKKRWVIYFLAGLVFGAVYWHYFSGTAQFFNNFLDVENPAAGIVLLIPVLGVYFGVWLIPAIFPAFYEFRQTASMPASLLAVITVFVSAVLGYYINYVAMLAFAGLPNMEHLVVSGPLTSAQWQEWSIVFPKLIFYKMIKWLIVGVLVGGVCGFLTNKIINLRLKKENTLPST